MTDETKGEQSCPTANTQETTVNLQLAIDVWKTAIQVQQHFNTIEMQIRNIAITVVTTTLGAAVLTSNQTLNAIAAASKADKPLASIYSVTILGKSFSSASLIIFAGLVAWGAFYFMDRFWYHRLLQGSVDHAQYIENQLKNSFPYLSLSGSIKQTSPFKFLWIEIHSNTKIDLFYFTIGLLLFLLAMFVF